MKFTLVLFAAFLVALLAGGGWLQWANYRETRTRVHLQTRQTLEKMASSLAPMVRAGDDEAAAHFLGFVQGILPVRGRMEVFDRTGRRMAASGVPPREGKGIYFPLSVEGEGAIGSVQVFLDEAALVDVARSGQRPGGTALFVAMVVAWILTEIFAAFVVFSPIKKLHRALKRALRRRGPVDLELLTEDLRSRGTDEVDSILLHTLQLIQRVRKERLPGQLEVVRDSDAETEGSGKVAS
jgi:hypothetical protein